ncbi:MAG: T9SS type A sorting domain-containing protein, partial [Bacteroidia bacterium]
NDGSMAYNWIRSGTTEGTDDDCNEPYDDPQVDPTENLENILNGTWSPFAAAAAGNCYGYALGAEQKTAQTQAKISGLTSVDIVLTNDKSKWTRAAVIEMQADPTLANNISKGRIKSKKPSVDKEGRDVNDAGYNAAEGDFNGAQPMGMGWFPGYAINVNTGERMSIAFGEDRWAGASNGNDMLWNPSSDFSNYGGMHYIFVFKNESYISSARTPIYDEGQYLYTALNETSASKRNNLWRTCAWIGAPLLQQGQELMATDVRIKLRVSEPYERFSTDLTAAQDTSDFTNSSNKWFPLYSFNTADLAHEENNLDSAKSALDRINIVPNPYYAYSEYEESRLDNRVKIINLPQTCTINIYNVAGNLVRTFKKDSEITFVDWDLKNHKLVPIASGMYIIHIDVPGVGEKVIKWMGVMRTPDLENL